MKYTWLFRGAVLLTMSSALFGGACGTTKIPLYPAEGKVLFNAKPAHGAVVWLHPVGNSDPASPRPHGRADKDGIFRLSTFETNDGAPAGKYQIAVFWTAATKAGDVDGKSLLPARYQNPQQSGLPMIEIKQGANRLAVLRLTQ
jgi:hypothetical protein